MGAQGASTALFGGFRPRRADSNGQRDEIYAEGMSIQVRTALSGCNGNAVQ